MPNERIFINDVEFELTNNTSNFARTFQVNDLISLQSRQTSYTKNIHIPKTPNNLKALGFIGEFGSTGYALPSTKIDVNYIVDSEFMIYKGWGVIEETTDDYVAINVYDGLIDLYKGIENLTLADLDLSELEHNKTYPNIMASMTGSTPYKYIQADYGGKCIFAKTIGGTSYNVINVDYMIPSVKVNYLIDKIFGYLGATYSGDIFTKNYYNKLFMTYSNGFTVDEDPIVYYTNSSFSSGSTISGTSVIGSSFVVHHNSPTPLSGSFLSNETYVIPTAGAYKFENLGTYIFALLSGKVTIPQRLVTELVVNDSTRYSLGYHSNIMLSLNVGDKIQIQAKSPNNLYKILSVTSQGLNLKYSYIGGNEIDFKTSLKEFTIKDFLNEFIYRFGLTMYKDKYQNKYTFKSFDEILNIDSSNIIDLSNKFIRKINEVYQYGNYGQVNTFTYKYNEANSTYFNKSFFIDNVNLSDEKIILNSKLYAPEQFKTQNFKDNRFYTQYLLWKKDINDAGDVSYKPLSNHFHFLTAEFASSYIYITDGLITPYIGSELTNEAVELTNFYYTTDLPIEPYNKFEVMLNDFKMVRAEMKFDLLDVNDFDFSKLYYIKQLGGYYLVNKIQDFQLGKTCIVELLRYQQ